MEFLSLNPRSKSSFLEGEQEASMLESCLTFLASLMSIRTNTGDPLHQIGPFVARDAIYRGPLELNPFVPKWPATPFIVARLG